VVIRGLAGVAVAALLAAAPASAQLPGLPANVVPLSVEGKMSRFAVLDFGKTAAIKDDRPGTTEWRVINGVHDPPFNWRGTGNCCESFPIASPDGRLFDIAGNWVNYSDDRGKTWMSVRPLEQLVNGEGALAVAPNGDVLAMTWDPYSGDHGISYKYDAASKQWTYGEIPVHNPVYDRPWLEVIPGPLTVNGQTVPYVSYVQGGTGLKEPWLMSTDGITYLPLSSPFFDEMSSSPVDGPLPVAADPSLDWNQPSTNGLVTPLGKGAALTGPYPPTSSTWGLLDPAALTWHPFTLAGGEELEGYYLADSGGRLHSLKPRGGTFDYSISRDGGRTWNKTKVTLPKGDNIENIDFRANRQLGLAAVAIHAHSGKNDNDVDLLYKLDITSDHARVTREYRLGRNDADASSGLGQNVRFDFEALAILPDGRVAMPMLDSTTVTHSLTMGDVLGPNLAIEGDTALSGKEAALPRLRVSLKVVRNGSRLVFSGSVKPKVPRRPVSIQQRSGSEWKAVARGRTSSRSTFRISKKLRARRGARFRATVGGDPAHRAGRSKTVGAR
jgi:hypothetical protein